jgi:hypothetical protein
LESLRDAGHTILNDALPTTESCSNTSVKRQKTFLASRTKLAKQVSVGQLFNQTWARYKTMSGRRVTMLFCDIYVSADDQLISLMIFADYFVHEANSDALSIGMRVVGGLEES